jgi:hypothetical protein
MHQSLAILCIAALTFGCKRAEPSFVPLGHGPLSLAEREAEAARPRPLSSSNHQDRESSPREPERGETPAPNRGNVQPAAPDRSASHDAGTTNQSATSPKDRASPANIVSIEDWPGIYRGNDTTIFRMREQPERRFDDPKAKIRIERGARNHLTLAFVDSSSGKDICDLAAVAEADTATIDAGQSCFLDPDESMTVRSRPGKATRKDRGLVVDLTLDTTMDTETGQVDGTIEYHFEGQR